jgi:kinesin family member 5
MRDLQNRCEKVGELCIIIFCSLTFPHQVVELEIQLDEIKEQYNNVIRNSNSKAQQKKMAFLERNLEQLTLVQKQVSSMLDKLFSHVALARRPKLDAKERSRDCGTQTSGS